MTPQNISKRRFKYVDFAFFLHSYIVSYYTIFSLLYFLPLCCIDLCCNILHRVPTYCSVLQCIALYCSVCIVLQGIALFSNPLHYVPIYCTIYCAVFGLCCSVLHCIVLYSTVLQCIASCCGVLYCFHDDLISYFS